MQIFGKRIETVVSVAVFLVVLNGCGQVTYPEVKVADAIKEICTKEYHINNVEVRFKGTTLGVLLPLKKLFSADIKKVLMTGEATDLEKLFVPMPDVVDQVENVLFATSRVVLSSNKKVDFYTLYATDIESTGLQLVLTGYIQDIKRVRLWDISRDDYRKRVMHELKLNRPVLWEKPIRGFFQDFNKLPLRELGKQYFDRPLTTDVISPLFYQFLESAKHKQNMNFDIKEIKCHSYEGNQALVYAKYRETYAPKSDVPKSVYTYPSGTEFEYIFVVDLSENGFKIIQIIPFYYLDEEGKMQKIPLPPDLDVYKNLDNWSDWFNVEEINLGEFLASQLNRRLQERLSVDERVHNTIQNAQINFIYEPVKENLKFESGSAKPYFSLYCEFRTREMKRPPIVIDDLFDDEDVLYVLNIVFKEFTDLMRSYQFKDYDHLSIVWMGSDPASSLELDLDRLELFRTKKISINTLLGKPAQTESIT